LLKEVKMDADNEPNLEGLKKLERAMRRLEKERVFVPGTVDEEMLGAVRQHFARVESPETESTKQADVFVRFDTGKRFKGRRVRRWQRWLPLAASIAIAAMTLHFARMGRTALGDVNRDGVVDVVDAFALAERVASGERVLRGWDVNRDGRVDAGDSNEIMARIVDLERSGS
jgi:hypothetical protein